MAIPSFLQSLIAEYSGKVINNPNHMLEAAQRVRIYKIVGPPVQEDLRRFYRWLGVLTAYKVLPLWQAAAPNLREWREARYGVVEVDYALPEKVLAMAEADLRGVAVETFDAGLYNEFGSIAINASYPAFFASHASYLVMDLFIDIEGSHDYRLDTLSTLTEKSRLQHEEGIDVAEAAVRSYTCTTPLPYSEVGASISYRDFAFDYDDLAFDAELQLEFWQWWLHEALPDAWKLATTDS